MDNKIQANRSRVALNRQQATLEQRIEYLQSLSTKYDNLLDKKDIGITKVQADFIDDCLKSIGFAMLDIDYKLNEIEDDNL